MLIVRTRNNVPSVRLYVTSRMSEKLTDIYDKYGKTALEFNDGKYKNLIMDIDLMRGKDLIVLYKHEELEQVTEYLDGDEEKENKKAVLTSWKGERGYKSLHWACSRNAPVDIIQKMIDTIGCLKFMNQTTDDGDTPLHLVCNSNLAGASVDVIRLLLNTGQPWGGYWFCL